MAEQTGEVEHKLPALRDDLELMPSARDLHGAPTWLVFDPLRNQYYQIDETGFQLMSLWRQGTPEKLIAAAKARFDVDVSEEQVKEFMAFLVGAQLVVADSTFLRVRLAELRAAKDVGLLNWLIHHYLFFRVPLVRPDRFLDWLYPRVRPLISGFFLRFTLAVGVLGIFLAIQRWQELVSAVPWFFTPEGVAVFVLVLVVVKIIHELGHGLACKHYGVSVPTMGVAFMVMWPVLYTDATDAWRLKGRRQRALIDSAGVISELAMACYALFFWSVLPDGLLRSVVLTVATSTIALSLTVNLNPFMRFDGYYFLSDIMNMPNLQHRAFALARWQIRKWIFGLNRDCPEVLPHGTVRWMLVYAYGTWIYRFFLFLGIALLVYHFFFKALGVLLFFVEIWWFILRPVVSEMNDWKPLLLQMSFRRRVIWGLAWLVFGLLVLVPWRFQLELPAQMRAEEFVRVFPAMAGQISGLHVVDGQRVEPGELLLDIRAPQLDHERTVAAQEVARLEGVLARSAGSEGLLTRRLVLEQELMFSRSRLQALNERHERLAVRSPVRATVRDLLPELHVGRWVSADTQLLSLVSPEQGYRVVAWMEEGNIDHLAAGAEGHFYPSDGAGMAPVRVRVIRIETTALAEMDYPGHASVFGGAIPVTLDEHGRMLPEVGVFRVWLEAIDPEEPPNRQVMGWVRLDAERRSLMGKLWRWVVGGLIREAGF